MQDWRDFYNLLECEAGDRVCEQSVEQVVERHAVVVNVDLLSEHLDIEQLCEFAGLAHWPGHGHPPNRLDLTQRRPDQVHEI